MAEISTSLETFSEYAKLVMTLRSRKTLNQPEEISQPEELRTPTLEKKQSTERDEPIDPAPILKAPFPSSLEFPPSLDKKDKKMNEMLELFKQVQTNLPLLDAIKQVPTYAKFIKDLCMQKRKTKAYAQKKFVLLNKLDPSFNRKPHPTLRILVP